MIGRISLVATCLVFVGCKGEAGDPSAGEGANDAPPAADAAAHEGQLDELSEQARQHTGAFAKSLKGALMAAMKAGGPAKGVEACNLKAPELAAAASKDGWTVGRTSTKLRNPANAPDAWETEVLGRFERAIAEGTAPQQLEFSEIVEADGVSTFRYAKAIPLGGECLACHGSTIDPGVKEALASRYPDDQATGYEAGALRGMFTLTKALRSSPR